MATRKTSKQKSPAKKAPLKRHSLRQTARPAARKRAPQPQPIALAHRLHLLLHTVRAIAHAEDELCTLLHAAEHNADISRELGDLLARIPAHDYVAELEALESTLNPPKAPSRRASTVKKTAPKRRK